MHARKLFFIFNTVAGRSQIRNHLVGILQILSGAGYEVACYPTKGKGDARRVAGSLRDSYDRILCAGGDGTLDEVVGGLAENPRGFFAPVGYIPAGTTNDFAQSLGIPSDMEKAAQAAVEGRVFSCDLGLMNGRDYFTYVAAFGIFTGTSYQTPQELKNQLGHLAYLVQGMSELGHMRAYRMRVQAWAPPRVGAGAPGEDRAAPEAVQEPAHAPVLDLTAEFAYGMVTNSRSIGGFPNITGREVDLSDGLFELTLVRMPKSPLEMSEILLAFGNPDLPSEMVVSCKASKVVLACDEQVAWTRDGEYAGACREVVLENCRRKFPILVPASVQRGE